MRPGTIAAIGLRAQVARRGRLRAAAGVLVGATFFVSGAGAVEERVENDATVFPLIKAEQRHIRYRDPATLPDVYVEPTPPPQTVREPLPESAQRPLSLDDAIRIALDNSAVVRQLAGVVAVSSGRTIYDPAITNNTIDVNRALLDPQVSVDNTFTRVQTPAAETMGMQTNINTPKLQNHNVTAGVSQQNLLGGISTFQFRNDASRFTPSLGGLNPQNRYAPELTYTQPLLRGAGVLANRVPIVLARIDTERSFFQLRDSLQELVRSVIDAYWQVVFARTDVWAREIQVQQAEESLNYSEARLRQGIGDVTETSQARAALAQFRASLIASRANLLSQEAALAGILGLPASEPIALQPTTPPTSQRIPFDWDQVTEVAQVRRPDLIELKLILEADQQRLILARNNQQPNLDLVGLYRWNGLEGTTPGPNGMTLSTNGGDATDWTVGVNFSVPLFLRAERAGLRSAELVVTRDRAILEQGVQSSRQILANNFRNLDQFYMEYEAFTTAREAAKINLERQFAAYHQGFDVIFLNVLQAINDWGNSVSAQAQFLTQYNIELANLERQTGTILETHAVFLYEDRYCSLGPLWIDPKNGRLYPRDIRPGENADRYPAGTEPSEQFFDLNDYPHRLPPTDGAPPYAPAEDLPPEPPASDLPAPTGPAEPVSPPLEFPESIQSAPAQP